MLFSTILLVTLILKMIKMKTRMLGLRLRLTDTNIGYDCHIQLDMLLILLLTPIQLLIMIVYHASLYCTPCPIPVLHTLFHVDCIGA